MRQHIKRQSHSGVVLAPLVREPLKVSRGHKSYLGTGRAIGLQPKRLCRALVGETAGEDEEGTDNVRVFPFDVLEELGAFRFGERVGC